MTACAIGNTPAVMPCAGVSRASTQPTRPLDDVLKNTPSAQDQFLREQMGISDPAFESCWMKQQRWAGTFPAMPACDVLAAANVLSNEQMKHPSPQVDAAIVGPVFAGFAMFMFISRLQSRRRYALPDPRRR
jgi:hypothetical protein